MYYALNRFQVIEGKEGEFETVWKERDSYLNEVPGFKQFHLLRGQNGEYISHSVWESQEAFKAWTESEHFRQAHAKGGSKGLLQGHPQFSGYTVVL